MKIAFVIQTLQYAGSERVAFELIRFLRSRRVECALITVYASGDPAARRQMLEELARLNVETVELNKPVGGGSFKTLRQLNRALNRMKPDIVHAHGGLPNVLAGIRNLVFSRMRTVLTLHSGGDDWRRPKDKWLERAAVLGANRIVSVADHVAERYMNRFGSARGKMVVIENGIDTGSLERMSEEERAQLRRELGIKRGVRLLTNVARIDPVKNQLFLVEVALRLKASRLPFQMLLVGNMQDPRYTSALRSRIERNGLQDDVLLLGSRSDVHRLLQLSDLFLFPSLFEASPLALLEAMYWRLPVVCSDIPGNRRAARLVGDDSIAVLKTDADRWALAIEHCLAGGEGAISAQPGDGFYTHVSLERVGNDYLNVCYAGFAP